MIPNRYAPMLFGLILSGLMSLVVSGISTLRVGGIVTGFAALWLGAWLTAWLVAFPLVMVIAPLARKGVERLTAER
jgi:hypothetical protein